MVYVDLSNSFTRKQITKFCKNHQYILKQIQKHFGSWVLKSLYLEEQLAYQTNEKLRPLAAVLDIDEIILCNIHMNTFQAPAGMYGPEPINFYAADYFQSPNGSPWPRDDVRLNPLLPGALDFIKEILRYDIKLYLITGRQEALRKETLENFLYVGLIGDKVFQLDKSDEWLIMKDDDLKVQVFKENRRKIIEKTHRITINIGDQISDLGLYGDKQICCPHLFYYTE